MFWWVVWACRSPGKSKDSGARMCTQASSLTPSLIWVATPVSLRVFIIIERQGLMRPSSMTSYIRSKLTKVMFSRLLRGTVTTSFTIAGSTYYCGLFWEVGYELEFAHLQTRPFPAWPSVMSLCAPSGCFATFVSRSSTDSSGITGWSDVWS